MQKNKLLQYDNISLSRKDVALILNCQPLTILNREKKGTYPNPTRNITNNYRVYSIADVFLLQMLTFQKIILPPIISLLYDKGYKDAVVIETVLNDELEKFKSGVDGMDKPLPSPIVKTQQSTVDE